MDTVQLQVGEVARPLRSARDGEPAALERLGPLVYEHRRRLALRQRGMEEQKIAATQGVTDYTMRREWVKAGTSLFRTVFLSP